VAPVLADEVLEGEVRRGGGVGGGLPFFLGGGGGEWDVKLYLVRAVPVLNSDERVSSIIAIVCPIRAELSRLPDSYSSTASTTVTIGLARREAEPCARWSASSSALRSSQSPASCCQVRDGAPC